MGEEPRSKIPNRELTLNLVPSPDAKVADIERFALTLNGYGEAGSFEACAEIALAKRQKTLTELRITLFFNQRARRFVDLDGLDGVDPVKEDRELLRLIRARIAAGKLE